MAQKAAAAPNDPLVLSSESHVRDALDEITEINAEITALEAALLETDIGLAIKNLRAERDGLEGAVETFILGNYKAGEGYEDDAWKVTKVVGHTRTWSAEKLKTLVPLGVFKNLTVTTVVPAKVDEYVRSKKIKLADISAAFEEKSNKPYVKVTKREGGDERDEAAELAAKLG